MANATEQLVDLHFPKAGIDMTLGFGRQPARQMPSGAYARTTREGVNVRSYDALANRRRGGSRPGLAKFITPAVVSDWIIQDLACVVGTYSPPGGSMQTSNSGRVVTVVAVSQGNVYIANAGDTAWTSATNSSSSTPPLNFSGILFSAANQQKLWFADGVHKVYYNPNGNTLHNWTLNAGTYPADAVGNFPRLICTWRGRTVVSGLLRDPQNWFMSKVNDPQDFDYSPSPAGPQQAIAGNNAPQGLIGDVITCLIPYSDDVLVFGGDHSIYMMRGDPMIGGQIDLVSDAIGMAWGEPWCKDPYGNIYFVSNRMGIYTLRPGSLPQRISQPIEQLVQTIDTGANGIRCIWDDRFQGLHVFVTKLSEPDDTTHFFFEQRSGAWWTDNFSNYNHNPLAMCVFDGNEPGDRVPLIGSWDGYVRFLDPDATKDDGYDIESSVIIGPLATKELDELLVKELLPIFGEESADVDYAIYCGATAEAALSSDPVEEGTWTAGRNDATYVQASAHAVYIKLSCDKPWAMESIRAKVSSRGIVAGRRSA